MMMRPHSTFTDSNGVGPNRSDSEVDVMHMSDDMGTLISTGIIPKVKGKRPKKTITNPKARI